MRYITAALLYWPVWLAFRYFEHSLIGILAGAIVVIAVWRLMWVMEFGNGDGQC